jgi:RimJ/RimL family protein N-acetyltransferase
MRTPVLRTRRYTLEPLQIHHARALCRGLSQPGLYRYLPDRDPRDLGGVTAQIRAILRGRSPDGDDIWCNWMIRRNADAACIGTLQATIEHAAKPRVARRTVLIGYMVFPPFWRQGGGTEAVGGMLDCLFDRYRCSAAEALVDTRNTGSLALLATLGFRVEARTDDADFFAGETSHELTLSLDRSAWRG